MANPQPQQDERREPDRRKVHAPRHLSRRGWKEVLIATKDEYKQDNVPLVAAGVAFYAFLALVPALAAIVSLYGLWASPADVQQQVADLGAFLPASAITLLEDQLTRLSQASGGALSLGLAGSVLFSLWSANKGMKALITAMNIAWDEPESRGFFKLNGISLLMTLGAVVAVLIALSLLAIVPALFGTVGLGETVETIVSIARWPVLALAVMVGLSAIYRYGPDRRAPRWRWVTWGSAVATILWLAASALFTVYVANFGSYSSTYGSIGAVVVLMMWLFISALAVLLGAEINSEIEERSPHSSQVGAS